MKFLVAQLGARMHYAIPRMLHEAEMLAHFYTDTCAVKGWPALLNFVPNTILPPGLQRLRGRIPRGVPIKDITAFTRFGLEYQYRLRSSLTPTAVTKTNLWAGQQFCELVLTDGLFDATGIYTFNGAALELLRSARRQGLTTVVEQTIAPKQVEDMLLKEERERFPNWSSPIQDDLAIPEYIARERLEWEHADLVLCGSEFVRESIAACGGPLDKCCVVPYGVSAHFEVTERPAHDGPIRVLTIGEVGLRKGSPYVLAAAKALRGQAIFRMVGGLNSQAPDRNLLSSDLELSGLIPRSQIQQHFAWADVFLLPSICEGSATAVYEALAAGLPVVCTPNTGSVIRNGIDGYIVPIRDIDAIVDALMKFVRDPVLLHTLGTNAKARGRDFTLQSYQHRLTSVLSSEVNGLMQ